MKKKKNDPTKIGFTLKNTGATLYKEIHVC